MDASTPMELQIAQRRAQLGIALTGAGSIGQSTSAPLGSADMRSCHYRLEDRNLLK